MDKTAEGSEMIAQELVDTTSALVDGDIRPISPSTQSVPSSWPVPRRQSQSVPE
jgi:hypothetical protein